jgi:hypothetical protein
MIQKNMSDEDKFLTTYRLIEYINKHEGVSSFICDEMQCEILTINRSSG